MMVEKSRGTTGSIIFCSNFLGGHYLVSWVRVSCGVSVTVDVRVMVSKLLGSD